MDLAIPKGGKASPLKYLSLRLRCTVKHLRICRLGPIYRMESVADKEHVYDL